MIVIPAAGEGRRFREAGYDLPKHLIPLGGVPMLDRVVENVRPLDPSGKVQVLTQEIVGKTRGTAETLALATVPEGEPLVVANCDQLLDFPAALRNLSWPDFRAKYCLSTSGADAVVFTFGSKSDAHSYVQTRENGLIWKIREKQVISNRAVSGVYWFKDSRPILSCCRYLVDSYSGDSELYLSAALRRMIALDYRVFAVDAPTAILGTPEDFQRYEVAMSLCR